MANLHYILPGLIKRFPHLLSRKTVSDLLMADKNAISYESASDCMAELDAAEAAGHLSKESENPIDTGNPEDFASDKEKDFTLEDTIKAHFANIKFKALVDIAKKEDTFLFTEFSEVEAARNRIASEIVSKYENDFNSFITALEGTEGTNKTIVNQLVQTKIHVGDLQ
jgi:hypothetical protein